MIERTAAGFILAHLQQGEPRYLLLRGATSGDWLPPKGHTDPGETTLQTALRETAEETGITDVSVVEGFERLLEYDVNTRKRGRYHKKVSYLLGTTPTTQVVCSKEHSEAGWFGIQDALARIPFEQMRELVRAADEFLRGRA
jgi:8-oxo-dGTP pyrophosphatase MutT (NUDIX family)